MLIIHDDRTIELTRGDTAYITVSISDYKFDIGDVIKFCVKRRATDTEYLFKKVVEVQESAEVVVIKIEPKDTKEALFKDYVYDVEYINKNGDVNTIIPVNIFRILKEVC